MTFRETISNLIKSSVVREFDDSISEDIFRYIQSEIIPKYDDLIDCHMYKLPEKVNVDVEYIFKLKGPLQKQEFEDLRNNVYGAIDNYCDEINEPYYILKILIVLSEI
ncbi:hypothetical protein [Methanobrevibacter sp.]|uniref:hypothetical protein n=1 Tax=Methanobrevibacter sp. TaxID=66852 RepID=UPI0038902530